MARTSELEQALKDSSSIGFPELIGIVENLFQAEEGYAPFNVENLEHGANKFSYTSGDYFIEYEVSRRGKAFEGSFSITNTAKRKKVLFSTKIMAGWMGSSPFAGINVNKRDDMYSDLVDAVKAYQPPVKE